MQTFEWSSKYETGIEVIDHQHQQLFSIVNELYQAIREHKNREHILVIAEKLEDYTQYHFSFEEKNLTKFQFDRLSQHMEQHELFKNKVKSFKNALAGNQDTNPLEMLDFLMDWLVDHILIKDKKYASLLKKNENSLISE